MKLFYKIISIIVVFPLFIMLVEFTISVSIIKPHGSYHQNRLNEARNLKVGIVVSDYLYINHGHTVGYHYELMDRFARENGYSTDITLIRERDSIWDKMLTNSLDIIILNKAADPVLIPLRSRVLTGIELNDRQDIFLVGRHEDRLHSEINQWVGYFKFSDDYDKMISNYYRRYETVSPRTKSASLSPYDELIKKYAEKINWDWRLLAALIYQESQFSMVATSRKNAGGLMQVRPATAEQFGIENIYDPEENIKAGTLMLERLEKMFRRDGLDSINLVKFTLAAYNAGEGRVRDIRRYARHRGVNSSDWDSVSAIISDMSKITGSSTIVRLGPFKGTETINYVNNIISRYESYKRHIQ